VFLVFSVANPLVSSAAVVKSAHTSRVAADPIGGPARRDHC
jgi:hypothetical protein